MIGLALALIVLGILFLFVIPWAAFVLGPLALVAGVALLVLYVVRRPARTGT